jgi:putative ABC transport system ATP-binding protein
MALIELQNIHKKYQLGLQEVEALKGISLKIEKGEFVSIAGPSGSGKSTILNILGLIDMPNSGTIFMNDERVFSEKEQQYYIKTGKLSKSADGKICKIRKNNIGFIFQNFNLLPVLNVYENIEYPLHLGGSTAKSMSKSEKKDWIMYLIEKVGLEKWMNHKPSELSGGQRQRVAIARSLVTKAPLILADEPTANLDSNTGNQILSLLQEINRDLNTTFIFSTHDSKIMNLANHIIRILDGKIVENSYSAL